MLNTLRYFIQTGLHKLCHSASLAVRKGRENEKMKRKWRENEEMEMKWKKSEKMEIHSPHFLIISFLTDYHLN